MGDGVRSFIYDDNNNDNNDEYENDTGRAACSNVYNCASIDGTGWYGFDNEWYYRYCDDNNNAVYRIWSYYYVGTYYLYYNTNYNSWHINWKLDDSAILYCGKTNLMDCGVGEWHEYVNGGWQETGGFTYECTDYRQVTINNGSNSGDTRSNDVGIGVNFNITHNCSENDIYGNNVCNGILWKNGISNFIYEGVCKSNYPLISYLKHNWMMVI